MLRWRRRCRARLRKVRALQGRARCSPRGRRQPLVTPCVTTHVFSTCTLQKHATALVSIPPLRKSPLFSTPVARPPCLRPRLERSSSCATSRPAQELSLPPLSFSLSAFTFFFSLFLIFVFYREVTMEQPRRLGARPASGRPPLRRPRAPPPRSVRPIAVSAPEQPDPLPRPPTKSRLLLVLRSGGGRPRGAPIDPPPGPPWSTPCLRPPPLRQPRATPT
uniref:Uncharacterized protein n=1 Tax=Triticum urartu TaxID=4572 RepID=A0A8R7TRX1_TRIUA